MMRAWLLGSLSLSILAAPARGATPIQAVTSDPTIRDLASLDASARVSAACSLRARGSDAAPALDALVALLADDSPVDPRVCHEAGSWSWRSGEPTSPGREAAITLAHIGSRAFQPLLATLDDARWVARRNAALGLGALDDGRAGPPLTRLLPREPEWQVRRQVAWALGALDDTDAVEALVAALGDEVAAVREQVAWALGAIGDPAATPALVNALKDPIAGVRKQAAWALGTIGKDTELRMEN